MEFVIKNISKSINDIMRTIGYQSAYHALSEQSESKGFIEYSIVRQVGRNDYPRFHLYVKEKPFDSAQGENENKIFIFNLHLDQKKPSYTVRISYAKGVAGGRGSHAHSGEYDGRVVEEESERIKSLLK